MGGAGAGLVTLRCVTAPWEPTETGLRSWRASPINTVCRAHVVSGQVLSPEAWTGHHDVLFGGHVTAWGCRAAPCRRQGGSGRARVP